MGPAALGQVTARITEIERQFAPPRSGNFRANLQAASAASAVSTAPASSGGGATVRTASAPDAGPATTVTTSTATMQAASTPSASAPSAARPTPSAGPVGSWARGLPSSGRAWAGDIERAATRAGVDPALLAALVWTESGFRPDAVSHAGARGLAQLMPATAEGLGVDPDDPQQNLAGGARFLRSMLDRFGTPALALAAYNAGPGRVADAGGIPNIPETQAYVPKVLARYDQIRGAA